MERLRQLVATHGDGFRLSEPFWGPTHLPPIATGCNRWAPYVLHRDATNKRRRRLPDDGVVREALDGVHDFVDLLGPRPTRRSGREAG
jgi:hypothetical protein